jgi:hypothetical protein
MGAILLPDSAAPRKPKEYSYAWMRDKGSGSHGKRERRGKKGGDYLGITCISVRNLASSGAL